MVLFNYSTRELTAKVVYYGPGLCGKTTNLQYIHSTLPDNVKGKMLSLATKTDRTLFFDFLPIDLGQIRGMKTRVQLYTVPGQVFYNETRKLVLKGADGIVFVADSQGTMLGANVESFKNLEENLKAHGMSLAEMPHVLQFNKRDLPKLSSIEELNSAINKFNAPFYESVATTGIGVQDTLKAITKLVLLHLTKKYDPKTAAASASAQAAPPSVSVGAPPRTPSAPGAPQMPAKPAAGGPQPPSPAQTMQMPAAGFQSPPHATQGIPLSSAPDVGADPPSRPVPPGPDDLMSSVPSIDQQAGPSFRDDEIQELVDEVQESEMESSLFGSGPAGGLSGGGQSDAIDLGQGAPPLDPHTGPPPSESSSFDPPVPSASSRPGADAVPSFEIDHGVDPDWGGSTTDRPSIPMGEPSAQGPAGSASSFGEEDVWDLGSIDDTGSAPPERVIPPADSPVEADAHAGLPRLTDVVRDSELFEESGVDVARLVAGEEREIVIPLEVEESDRMVQRFKLSIRLRMEPID